MGKIYGIKLATFAAEWRAVLQKSMVALLFLSLCGCHDALRLSPPLRISDDVIGGQLLFGFYPADNHSWRWVRKRFSVALTPPPITPGVGARLVVNLYLPDAEIQTTGPITLGATIDGRIIGTQTFSSPGTFEFVRDLPFEVVDTNILPVQFCFDKSFSPESDKRELSAVISRINLVTRQDARQDR